MTDRAAVRAKYVGKNIVVSCSLRLVVTNDLLLWQGVCDDSILDD